MHRSQDLFRWLGRHSALLFRHLSNEGPINPE